MRSILKGFLSSSGEVGHGIGAAAIGVTAIEPGHRPSGTGRPLRSQNPIGRAMQVGAGSTIFGDLL